MMKYSKKMFILAIIALLTIPTVTSVLAAKPLKYHVQKDMQAGYYQKIVDRKVEEWAWGKANLMLMPEKEIVSFHATLKTADDVIINYRLKDYISMEYRAFSDSWSIKGVYEVKYGEEVITVENALSYSVRYNTIGSMYFPELGIENWHLGTTLSQVYEP